MPKWFSEQEKELIRKRLLEQGYRLFSAHGLKKTNVEELARAVGISKGAFYHFYENKEMLFMEVVEQVEKRVRQEILAVVAQPGPSPRARLLAVFKAAFALIKDLPILQIFTGGDYDLLFRRLPAEKLRQHVTNDQVFIEEVVRQCRQVGISIRAPTEQLMTLMYPLISALLHEDNLERDIFPGGIEMHLELVAAFCLGEIELQSYPVAGPAPDLEERGLV
jgi:AcrR family transcriptional regulator